MKSAPRWRPFLLIAGLLIAVQLHGPLTRYFSSISQTIAADAQAYPIPTINGEQLMQRITASDKPTLIFLYATWCPYCRKETPVIEQAASDYKDRINILPISIDEDLAKLSGFLAERSASFTPLRIAPNDYAAFRLAMAKTGSGFTGSIPHIAIFSPDGTLIDETTGFLEYPALKSALDRVR